MKADTVRTPRRTKRPATQGEQRQGYRSLGPTVIRYGLRVSKDDRTFAKVLSDVIDRYYESDSDFAASAGVSSASVSRYVSGQSIPSPKTIDKLAPHMRMSVERLRAIVYPSGATAEPTHGELDWHPLALDLNRLLGGGSTVPAAERSTLETLVGAVMTPYRRYLRNRKSA